MKSYILITDIGRDSDDTLALIVLLYYHKISKIKLLSIAVSGAKLIQRANCVFYWLSYYKIDDISVIIPLQEELKFDPIDIDDKTKRIIKDIDSNVCILPYDEKTVNINLLKKNIKVYASLNDFFNTNTDTNINMLIIAPVRPLYTCLHVNPKVIDRINNIYFQGNVYYDKKTIIPDIRKGGKGSYNFGSGFDNFEEIKDETSYVINTFNNKYMKNSNNKLYFLGKHTAYLIEFNEKYLNLINKPIASLSIKKTLMFAKNLPNVFNMVFKDNINHNKKRKIMKKYKPHIRTLIDDKTSSLNKYLKDLNDRLVYNVNKDYLLNEIRILENNIANDDIDSYYYLFIQFMIDENDIDNEYTKDFLQTINKINNPYDLVLVYLALFEDLFDFKHSKFLKENDKVYKNTKHIQFNEKNDDIFDKKYMLKHMKKLLQTALKYRSK
jgi:hypothetical protein